MQLLFRGDTGSNTEEHLYPGLHPSDQHCVVIAATRFLVYLPPEPASSADSAAVISALSAPGFQ